MNRGPSTNIELDAGVVLLPGIPQSIPLYKAELLGDQVFILHVSAVIVTKPLMPTVSVKTVILYAMHAMQKMRLRLLNIFARKQLKPI